VDTQFLDIAHSRWGSDAPAKPRGALSEKQKFKGLKPNLAVGPQKKRARIRPATVAHTTPALTAI
jgi:hypothetical protein